MKRRRKAPTKTELMQLQKLYKTDEKIGERLGGVPAYLVAYWRRKKNIAKYSLPKFSEQEVRNLWERYGDDEKSGLELGISKAAFYNWRRRYAIKDKPAFLKLEQLEIVFPGTKENGHASQLYGGRTMTQKVYARAANIEAAEVGATVTAEPDLVVIDRGVHEVIEKFRALSVEYVWNPSKVVVMLDPHATEHNGSAGSHAAIREFCKRQGIKNVFDMREGGRQQVTLERGLVLPGQLVVMTDDSSFAYGGMSAMTAAASVDDVARLMATGRISLEVPGTARVAVGGHRPRGVYATDVALSLLTKLGEVALDRTLELGGSVISQMTISERFTISDLLAESGAAAAVGPYDATTRRYLNGRSGLRYAPVVPDKDVEYEHSLQTHIDHLAPQVARVDKITHAKPVGEIEGQQVPLVVIGSNTNGRFDELRAVADVLKGKHVHNDCRLLLVPASRAVYLEALKKGLVRVFVEAGAVVMHPGWCPQSQHDTPLIAAERCLAATGLQSARQLALAGAEVWMCSPATAAASALHGVVTDPVRFVR